METIIIEASHEIEPGVYGGNWGKFMVARFTHEEMLVWSRIDQRSVIGGRGLDDRLHYLVLDLETKEGAIFRPGGLARADLQKHKIWVCPLFEPFLNWLYKQDLSDFSKLPTLVGFKFNEAGFDMAGYRRPGPPEARGPRVHFILHCRTPCEMKGMPGDWPEGHRWDYSWANVTCELCLEHKPSS
jgi:hypothetical protein